MTPVSMTSSDDIPSIYHNPFAGHSESSFTSAISPKRSHADTRPIYRRRGSESLTKRSRNDHDPWIANADWASGISHARSQTADSHFPASTSATSLHPLALGVHISASFSDLPSPSDTRPYLKRAMSDMVSGANGADDVPEATTPASSEGGDEKVVIVHEVCYDNCY